MTKTNTPLYIAISLDIDPDANTAVAGRYDALSSPIQYGRIQIGACKKGLQKIFRLLDTYAIEATLFYEARTAQMLIAEGMDLPGLSERHEVSCHSLKHEDFTGKVSGMPMKPDCIERTIIEATQILENIFGRVVKGFRAPYTRINAPVVQALEKLGFRYDSSETIPLGNGWKGNPFPLEMFNSHLLELALPSLCDVHGKKMSSYLWAFFEGKRIAREYIDIVLHAREIAKGGLFIIAMHPWHFLVNYRGIPFSKEQADHHVNGFEYILSRLKQLHGVQLIRMDNYLETWLKSGKA